MWRGEDPVELDSSHVKRHEGHSYKAHRAVIFTIAQLSCKNSFTGTLSRRIEIIPIGL